MAMLELTPRGTPQMYYGEEIGMRTTEPTRKEDVRDPIGITGWPKEKGRDGERTPMQWTSAAPNAGFTPPTATPWLPVPPNAPHHQRRDRVSRPRQPPQLLQGLSCTFATPRPPSWFGDYVDLNPDDANVFSFMRKVPQGGQGHNLLVALNMSATPHTVHFDTTGAKSGTVLESNFAAPASKVTLNSVELPPFGASLIALD